MTGQKLSKREYEVLVLLTEGYKNKDIAKKLGLKEKTIGEFVLRLRMKSSCKRDDNLFKLIKQCVKYGFINKTVFE